MPLDDNDMYSSNRRPLANSIALAMLGLSVATATFGRDLVGPGTSHTINPGDPTDIWFVRNGATLILAPGAAMGYAEIDASSVQGDDVRLSGPLRLYTGSTGAIRGGSLASGLSAGSVSQGSRLEIDSLTANAGTRGFSVSGVGSYLSLSNSSILASGEALEVGRGATLELSNVLAASDGSMTGGQGFGLRMYGGNARVADSNIAGEGAGIHMAEGKLWVENSIIHSQNTSALAMFHQDDTVEQDPEASFTNTTLTGNSGAYVDTSSMIASNSAIIGRERWGISMFDASITLRNSLVKGQTNAVEMLGWRSLTSLNSISLEGSQLVSFAGPAIDVAGGLGARIDVLAGSTIVGGDGTILRVRRDAGALFSVVNSNLSGSIQVDEGAALDMALRNRASLQGAVLGASALSMSNSAWLMTRNSSTGSLYLGAGSLIQLSDGTTSNTLSVGSDYQGQGGTILFHATLSGDDSATDRLMIAGSTAGQTNVRVNNVGGTGAQTRRGIELITVVGASKGQFDLAGRAVGGQYEYFLFQDAGNWYLRSQLPTTPEPCDADATLPGCGGVDPVNPVNPVNPVDPMDPVDPPVPAPVLRPEGGAYLGNLQAAQTMFRLGYQDRHSGQNSGRAWAQVDGSRTHFDAVSRQLNVQGNSHSLTVGADVWRNDSGSGVGVMLSSGNATSTSTNALSGYYARGKVKGEALGVYATWRAGNAVHPYAGFYVDGSLQRAQLRNRVEGLALNAERYDTRAWQGAVEAGYAFLMGSCGTSTMYLEPQLQIGYIRWDSYRHTETNGTEVAANNAGGMLGRVGVRLSGVTRWSGGAAQMQPFLAVNWLHNRSEAEISMDGEKVDARIPRSRAELSAGASAKFTQRLRLWGSLSRQLGSRYHQASARVGLSYDW